MVKLIQKINFFLSSKYIFLALATIIAFWISLSIRREWYQESYLSQHGNQWNLATTARFARNWYEDGVLNLKFGMFHNPPSIEFEDLEDRGLYYSYPPVTIIPVYFLAKILDCPPNLQMVKNIALLNHFIISLFVSFLTFYIFKKNGIKDIFSLGFSSISILLIIFLPASLYWFQNVYFVDQAIILPVLLIIFLEVKYTYEVTVKKRLVIQVLQSLIIFVASLIDWYLFIVILIIFIKRIDGCSVIQNFRKCLKEVLVVLGPAFLGLLIFSLQLSSFANTNILQRFLIRTGIHESGKEYVLNFAHQFWRINMMKNFGLLGTILFLASFFVLIVFFFKKILNFKNLKYRYSNLISILTIIYIPPILQVYLFRNHSVIHDFSTIKFLIPISLGSLALIPLLIGLYYRNKVKEEIRINKMFFSMFILCFSLCSVLLIKSLTTFHHLYPESDDYMPAQFIGDNTNYHDVVFSPHYIIEENPPQKLYYSWKRVYLLKDINSLNDKLLKLEGDYIVNVFIIKNREVGPFKLLEEVRNFSEYEIESESYIIYKLSKENYKEFLDIMEPKNEH